MWKRETPATPAMSSSVNGPSRWLSIYQSAFWAGFMTNSFPAKRRQYGRFSPASFDRPCCHGSSGNRNLFRAHSLLYSQGDGRQGNDMKITDVRAHHIRIPYDAGVASFRQGASAIAALDIVLVEVSTDAGLTGWGDAFSYVCPRTTYTAIEEMIAPQAKGLEVPEPAAIPVFMEQIQRNL